MPQFLPPVKIVKSSHWIAQLGMHGYLAETSYVCDTKESAVESICTTADVSAKGRVDRELRKYGMSDLHPRKSNDLWYVSISECNCDEPWIHDEGMTEREWKDTHREDEDE